jgi:hypothetical protein
MTISLTQHEKAPVRGNCLIENLPNQVQRVCGLEQPD